MTNGQILAAILSSSVLSALLTSVVNFYITSLNYKNEYYKKLLDKRLDAYQEVYNFLSNIKTYVHDSEDSLLTPYILANGVEALDQAVIAMLVPLKKSFWLSGELADRLTELNVLFVELSNKANRSSDPDKELKILGNDYLEKIRALRKKIQYQIQKDLETLDDVKKFIKKRESVL